MPAGTHPDQLPALAASADAFAHSGHPLAMQAAGVCEHQEPPGSEAAHDHSRSELDPAVTGIGEGWPAAPALQPVPHFAADGPHSNGGVSRLLREAQYLYLYPPGSEEHQVLII